MHRSPTLHRSIKRMFSYFLRCPFFSPCIMVMHVERNPKWKGSALCWNQFLIKKKEKRRKQASFGLPKLCLNICENGLVHCKENVHCGWFAYFSTNHAKRAHFRDIYFLPFHPSAFFFFNFYLTYPARCVSSHVYAQRCVGRRKILYIIARNPSNI